MPNHPEIKKLIKALDKAFSEFIRLRDSDSRGIGKCVTCNRSLFWKNGDCGHYQKRQHYSTRWDEQNCHLQCKRCNAFEQGANEIYRRRIDSMYWEGAAALLELKARNRFHLYAFWLEAQIKEYREKVAKLKELL